MDPVLQSPAPALRNQRSSRNRHIHVLARGSNAQGLSSRALRERILEVVCRRVSASLAQWVRNGPGDFEGSKPVHSGANESSA